MTVPVTELRPLLERWLPAQRWFAGKGRKASFDITPLAVLRQGPPEVSLWTAHVEYVDGGSETYQIALAVRDEPVTTLEHVLLGSVRTGDSVQWIYDALHDRDVTSVWLEGIRDERRTGPLTFGRYVAAGEVPVGETSLVLNAEQSNTSLIFGDKAILKVFRRLEPGINPDIEVHEALTRSGARNVAALLGSLTADIDGQPYSLGMLQQFLTSGTDGWELAKASVRDLLAEADLHPDEVGGDFAGEAERLGAAVAEVHLDLAQAFDTGVLDADTLRQRGRAMLTRLDQALDIVPELGEHEAALRQIFADFVDNSSPLPSQRIHGDLHLGQAMRTVRRWVVLDFEGEPVGSIASRRRLDSPLRDVAGMLRSFDYASHHQLADGPASAQLSFRADEWAERNRTAFSAGYAAHHGSDPAAESTRLLAFEADKAVYEAIYEARNRPSWLRIPLSSLTRLTKTRPTVTP